MSRHLKYTLLVLILFAVLVACAAPVSPEVIIFPTDTSMASPTLQVATISPFPPTTSTPLPTLTVERAIPAVRTTPLALPSGLSVEEYILREPPTAESLVLYFTHGDPRPLHFNELYDALPNPYCSWNGLPMCVSLGGHQLVAEEIYTSDANYVSSGEVVLRQDGVEIYRIAVGPGSPLSALRGMWVYDGHWVLEAAKITETRQGDNTIDNAVGRIIVDGKLLNETQNYEEAFGFQTIHGHPFYFFKRDGRIEASYNGVEIPLDYDQIPHYGCCSAATLNPQRYKNMVDFFALRDGTWYYIDIGVFNQP